MALFPTTHWSLLAQASLNGNSQGRKALEELCRRYWSPVHQFIKTRGLNETDAEDLTQEFMLHLVEKSTFGRADRLRGRFRSFLLGALVRFLGDAADRRNALKRGGTVAHQPFEDTELSDAGVPAEIALTFDREWALTLLESALSRIRAEYSGPEREAEFSVLKCFLPGGREAIPYGEAAARLRLSEPAFKSEIHRLRRRFRALVREEVAQTVSAPHEIEAEMNHLQAVLMDKGTLKPGSINS